MRLIVGFLIFSSFFMNACRTNDKNEFAMGSYGYDASFFQRNGIEIIELSSQDTMSKVMVIPAYQGRVMTSTAGGDQGTSFGWINYKLIESKAINPQFNPVGGEERFWLGPEGGDFSYYFKKGEEQVYENWRVPAVLDTESFDIESQNDHSVTFVKQTSLPNASETQFDIKIRRTVSVLSREDISRKLNIELSPRLQATAYTSENTITNAGDQKWTKETGLPSIWLLGMFNPTPTTTVFIPYKTEAEGRIVNDEYFGKVPAERLIADNGILYFKIDGKYRSKIGLPAERVKEFCGSYDSEKGVLTFVFYTVPDGPVSYVNGQWGEQESPFGGDVINSYNDGPVADGSIMGPFYEIETSSPGAELAPGQSLTHTQTIMHIQGEKADLDQIALQWLGVTTEQIAAKFQ